MKPGSSLGCRSTQTALTERERKRPKPLTRRNKTAYRLAEGED